MKRKLAFSILIFVVSLVLLESVTRLFETAASVTAKAYSYRSGWQAEFFASLFDWHEPDVDLLWRFKAGLNNRLIKTNSDHLIGDEVSKAKAPQTFRILLLGDSSPVGIGLKSRGLAFPELLGRLLEAECLGSKNVEVINAAVSGYTSEQIARFLELKGWSYRPDVVILYCGNNDASISGLYSDKELLNNQRLQAIRRPLSHLAIYRLLRNILTKHLARSRGDARLLKLRVAPDRFAENLHRILNGCREHNIPLIVIKPPVPYLWPGGLQFKIFTSVAGKDGQMVLPAALAEILGRKIKYCLSDETFDQVYGHSGADKFTKAVYLSAYADSLSPPQAIRYYTELLEKKNNNPVLLNNLGVSFWEDGQYQQAGYYLQKAREAFANKETDSTSPALIAASSPFLFNLGINYLFAEGGSLSLLEDTASIAFKYLDSALQTDYFSLRIKRDYLKKIDELMGLPNVTVVDLGRTFRENGGDKLFIDHCHPTAEGHFLIAKELFKIICRRLSPRI